MSSSEPDDEPAEVPQENGVNVSTFDDGTELERTIGLRGGLSIGIGTMIGAGIFVFPGIAAGEAGPAAAGSFAIGMVIALLVALPTSELATAMPRSGGGYYFISRGLGSVFGTVVGIGLWLGLVFASAFYLVGFANYASEVLVQLGVLSPSVAASAQVITPLALVFGLFLTVLNTVGTENAAKLQNNVVGILIIILVLFLGFGVLSGLGVVGEPSAPEAFAPFGIFPIFTTAALVFTSYLGFAQVATVAGEMKNPGKNLPRAMVGSVLVVGILYVVTIFVATSTLGSQALAQAGETAMVAVAAELLGDFGALAILIAGLLATISSANASILSTSRAVFAVSRDALLPRWAGRVNRQYGTPHVALALAGGPILFLVLIGQVEILAEVASSLHLVLYGLMCFALVVLRRNPPEWYDPDYKTPLFPVIPILGGLASFGLIIFMNPLSILIGAVIIVASIVWYFYYASDVKLKGKL